MTSLYLVCLNEPDPRITRGIRDLFGEDDHYVLNDTQIIVVKSPNGGKSVYARIKEKVGQEFVALVVRLNRYHGRHQSELWEWLENPGGA